MASKPAGRGAELSAGRYAILGDRLAKGGYGEVFQAWDGKEQRLVAMKRQRGGCSTASRELNAYLVPRGLG